MMCVPFYDLWVPFYDLWVSSYDVWVPFYEKQISCTNYIFTVTLVSRNVGRYLAGTIIQTKISAPISIDSYMEKLNYGKKKSLPMSSHEP